MYEENVLTENNTVLRNKINMTTFCYNETD